MVSGDIAGHAVELAPHYHLEVPMDFDAITLDTQTVEANGFRFDRGLLAQLKQFRNGPTDVVLSEITAKEIRRHLIEKTRQAKDRLENSYKEAIEFGLIDASTPEPKIDDVESIVKSRLESFFAEIGAKLVKAEAVTVPQLLKLYFATHPPFAPTGKKKNEFPDAIALLSLESWARKEGKRLLAISNDKDWSAFAERSTHVTVISKLTHGLEMLQSNLDQTNKVGISLLDLLVAGTNIQLNSQFHDALREAVSSAPVIAEADSAYEILDDQVEIEFLQAHLVHEPGKMDFNTTQASSRILTIQVGSLLAIKARGVFSLAAYDSIDKDYVDIGPSSVSRDIEIEASILITFEGDIASSHIALSKVEFVKTPLTIDFGYIDPSADDLIDETWDSLDDDGREVPERLDKDNLPF